MALKRIPGRASWCIDCKKAIVFALVQRTQSGRGGRYMPFDAEPNDEGRFAVRVGHNRQGIARALLKDEGPDRTCEVLAMPHAATCVARTGRGLGDEMESWLKSQTEAGSS